MSLSALIKKGGLRGTATATLATSATDEAPTPPSVATVATVAVATAPKRAVNDPAHVQDFDAEAFEERAGIAQFDGGLSRPDAEALAAQGMAFDPDRQCWPNTNAMNTAEIDTFMARVHLFTVRGLNTTEAERMADPLVRRDREADDRRLCLECSHLRRGAGLWRCGQWQRAGLAVADVPGDVVNMLQRCSAFNEATR
ncbi:MAG: hypothetical protein EOP38_26910 [Rubrivivax sp.]|nr:MAG: hypothetical protein EOP38_26910 [Rubrivivax sp.]